MGELTIAIRCSEHPRYAGKRRSKGMSCNGCINLYKLAHGDAEGIVLVDADGKEIGWTEGVEHSVPSDDR